MKFFKKNNVKNTQKQTLPKNVKKYFLAYCTVVLCITFATCSSITAFADTNDPLKVVNNLSDFIFSLIRAIGFIMSGFGIVQFGLSFKSHDGSQRANGIMCVAGGIIIMFAKEILNLITA